MATKLVRIALALAISTALLAFVLTRLGSFQAATRLREFAWGPLAGVYVLSAVILLVRGVRFARMGKTPVGATLAATAVQNFLNRVLPMRLGELSFPWMLERSTNRDPIHAVLDIVVVRLLDLTISMLAVVFGAVVLAGDIHAPDMRIVVAFGVAIVLVLLAFRRLVGLASRALLAVTRAPVFARFRSIAERVAKAAATANALSRKARLELVVWSLVLFALQAAAYGRVLAAWNVHVAPLPLLFASGAVFVGAAIFAGGFGAFGSLEAGWLAGFVAVNVPRDAAVVTALGCQLATLAFAAFHAVVGWLAFEMNPMRQRLRRGARP